MQQINCLNLCEILPYLTRNRSLSDVITDTMELAQYSTCERVYVGSNFCGKYFLHQSEKSLAELLKMCQEQDRKITLVVPTFSQGDLKAGKGKIQEILMTGAEVIDEVTVNDYGMLVYCKEHYNKKVNMGRLFMKDYRDPRYVEYFQTSWKPKMFTDYFKDILNRYSIHSCEFDITHQTMDFSELPENIVPGIHAPYCYQTVGRICEYASINKDLAKKFRPNDRCEEACSEHYVKYEVSDESMEYIRYGRTVYYKHPGYELTGLKEYRLLYFPIEL